MVFSCKTGICPRQDVQQIKKYKLKFTYAPAYPAYGEVT